MLRVYAIFLTVMLFSGCTSYHVFPVEYRDSPQLANRTTVWIANPELVEELEILRHANIFILSDSVEDKPKLTLKPLNVQRACGNPMMGWILFLGLLPATLPDEYWLEFDIEEVDGTVQGYKYYLQVAQRYWLFDMILPEIMDTKIRSLIMSDQGGAHHGQEKSPLQYRVQIGSNQAC